MEITKQVATLTQGQKLYDLGISKTGHLFSWVYDTLNQKWDISSRCVESFELTGNNAYPAFTFAELSQMLPESIIDMSGISYIMAFTKEYDYYSESISFTAGYYNFNKHDWYYGCGGISPIESIFGLLIMLLEKNKTTIVECNERLNK